MLLLADVHASALTLMDEIHSNTTSVFATQAVAARVHSLPTVALPELSAPKTVVSPTNESLDNSSLTDVSASVPPIIDEMHDDFTSVVLT